MHGRFYPIIIWREYMSDEKKFLEMLYEIVEIARINGDVITVKEIDDYFEGMDLTKEKLEAVYDYLIKGNITVKGYIADVGASVKEDYKNNSLAKKEKYEREVQKTSAYTKEYRRKVKEIKDEGTDAENLYNECLDTDNEVLREGLIKAYMPQVINYASKYANKGVLTDELIQEGNLSLVLAVNTYMENLHNNKNRDFESFDKYVKNTIREGVIAIIDKETLTQSELMAAVGKAELVKEAVKHLANEFGRVATLKELSDFVHLSEEEIQDIVRFTGGQLETK